MHVIDGVIGAITTLTARLLYSFVCLVSLYDILCLFCNPSLMKREKYSTPPEVLALSRGRAMKDAFFVPSAIPHPPSAGGEVRGLAGGVTGLKIFLLLVLWSPPSTRLSAPWSRDEVGTRGGKRWDCPPAVTFSLHCWLRCRSLAPAVGILPRGTRTRYLLQWHRIG